MNSRMTGFGIIRFGRARFGGARLWSAALVLGACADDSTALVAGGGSAGVGNVGAGGETVSVGGTGNDVGVVPDPLKNCGVAAGTGVPALELTLLAEGLDSPVYLTQVRGDDARLFVLEKSGTIRIIRAGQLEPEPFLDISDRVSNSGEMGLLGLAFHPGYADNGRFYVYYSTMLSGSHTSRIAEYSVSDASPDQSEAASERILLEVPQPQSNHNGGSLEFGPDGFLYIGLGDGGGGGDQHGAIGNGQNLDTLLGKILRIDVDSANQGSEYGIPAGNLAREGARPEIWSYGLRNPWRFSFDACTGDMYIGDVGQGALEEVDFEPANTSGRNYGWRLMEAENCFNPNNGCNADTQNLVLPVASYARGLGRSITGGYVYRGSAIPNLRGTYLYADYASAAFFALRMNGSAVDRAQQDISNDLNPGRDVSSISSFGQDNVGELYVLSLNGAVYRVDAE
jgi:glucose/arabinose dehydrogenase